MSEGSNDKVQNQVSTRRGSQEDQGWTIEKYVDEVLYDMVSMDAGHVLLRRPWRYDRVVVHNGVTN